MRSSGGTDDNTLVRSILDEINITATVVLCRRIPTKSTSTRPLLLLVSFSDIITCSNIIKVAKNLRSSSNPLFTNFFINPDLTHEQRAEQQLLNDERKLRKANSKDVIIRNGKLFFTQPQCIHDIN